MHIPMLTPFGNDFIFAAINLLFLYILLRKFLFKPVTAFMEKRKNAIKDSIDQAEKNKAESEDLKKQYADKLRSAKDEADHILNEARIRANKEYESIISAARQNAENVLAQAREDIDRKRLHMQREVRSDVASLALAAASKVIETNMNTEINKALVDKFINEAGAA